MISCSTFWTFWQLKKHFFKAFNFLTLIRQDISKYFTDSQEASNFYYTVEERSTGIKISFIIIYIIIVSLLLFISITIAIRFSSRFFRSINNLILASTEIGQGNLNTKVTEIKTHKDMEILNQDSFKENLKIINGQIKQIENLVNEFSDFARMPKPILKENDLIKILNDNIKLLSELNKLIEIKLIKNTDIILFKCDKEQIGRVFFNLIKNSIESIQQKSEKNPNFNKKILIEI